MRYRTIGTDRGREVSTLALAVMMFGTETDERTSFALLGRFAGAGGTFVDTSASTVQLRRTQDLDATVSAG